MGAKCCGSTCSSSAPPAGGSCRRVLWAALAADAAVMLAALGVFGTGTGRPDLAVAAIPAALAVDGVTRIVRRSLEELRSMRDVSAAAE